MTKSSNIFLCSCETSQKVDAKTIGEALGLEATPKLYSHLCRTQIGELKGAHPDDGAPVICCTQETPVLMEFWQELAEASGTEATSPVFVNIRENAGWSQQGDKAAPKMAALIAEAQVKVAGAATVSFNSSGNTLVLGRDETALAAAKRLVGHLNVSFLLDGKADITPPSLADFPVYCGKIVTATGHLGNYTVNIDGLGILEPSSRDNGTFTAVSGASELQADIIIDLRGDVPLFRATEKRDGYLRVDIGDRSAVERTLFDAIGMVGEFEKPRYIEYNSAICAHSRSNIVACTRCVDICPTGALISADEKIVVDAHVCAGCGSCAGTCPTGAITYQYSGTDGLHDRARALLDTYARAGGENPVLLIKDRDFGDEVISIIARSGSGLPANVLPFTVNEVTQIGLETLLAFGAFGVSAIMMVANPRKADETDGLEFQINLANTIFEGLGYGAGRIRLLIEQDPSAIEEILSSTASLSQMPGKPFIVNGPKRSSLSAVLRTLHTHAPAPVDRLALPKGAPLGSVTIDAENCTLCLACVGACPTGALKSNPETPQLRFSMGACVQCGLCHKTCPEKVITLTPEIDFIQGVRDSVILKEEAPFECITCGKPFATASSIKLMTEKLQGHAMFSAEGAMDRLKMCEICRVADIVNAGSDPWDTGQRRGPKTTDDYLKERNDED